MDIHRSLVSKQRLLCVQDPQKSQDMTTCQQVTRLKGIGFDVPYGRTIMVVIYVCFIRSPTKFLDCGVELDHWLHQTFLGWWLTVYPFEKN